MNAGPYKVDLTGKVRTAQSNQWAIGGKKKETVGP